MLVSDSPIHLAIAFDKNYLKHFYALFASILTNNGEREIHIHAIAAGIFPNDKKRITDYAAKSGVQVSFYEIDEALVKKFVLSGKWSSAVYYRLFFPMIVPENVSRILYLDTDIIVIDDLAELFAVDMEGFPVAAVYDNWVKTAPQLGIFKEGDYFNSGVMLIDVPSWKKQEISNQVFSFLEQNPEKIKFVDQCGLNAVLINNWKKLDTRFNVMRSMIPDEMSKKEKSLFLKSKVIIHYTLDRPWNMLCKNPYRHLYFHYLRRSPFMLFRKYDDFSIEKIPELLKINLIETYHELPVIKVLWQKVKAVVKRQA